MHTPMYVGWPVEGTGSPGTGVTGNWKKPQEDANPGSLLRAVCTLNR